MVCESPIQYNLFNEVFAVPFSAPENPKFTFIDLFAGIGGFRIAMQNLGGKCVYSSEWDTQAQKTYFANFGEVPFGDITKEEIYKANNIITNYGFELHWKYNKYVFEEDKHRILKIRYDCDKIDNVDSKYILLADDDLEFLYGYDRYLLIALNFLQDHDKAGIVNFHEYAAYNNYKQDVIYPANMAYAFSCYGGLLIRRIKDWGGLYPEYCLYLYGGGEEQLQGIEILNYGLQGYFMNCKSYKHEQHWSSGEAKSGQGFYRWQWNRQNPFCIMGKIRTYESTDYIHDKAWKGDRYWEYNSEVYSYENNSSEELLKKLK